MLGSGSVHNTQKEFDSYEEATMHAAMQVLFSHDHAPMVNNKVPGTVLPSLSQHLSTKLSSSLCLAGEEYLR